MSLLHILRNLAVLLILAVAVLVSTPRPAAGGDDKHSKPKPGPGRCSEVGQECASILPPCCPGLVCVPASTRAFCEDVF
jgi:hypothetical protein